MKSLIVHFALLFCIPFINASTLQSGYRFFDNLNSSLKLFIIPTTWSDALLQCEMEGGTLASPVNSMVLKAMVTMLQSQSVTRPIFTGIHATFANGVYTSIEGVPLENIPTSWAPNEPDNFENNEDCLTMDNQGYLADVKCSELHPFICYKESKEPLNRSESLVVCGNADYNFEPETGSCYKFEPIGDTWTRAFRSCAADGGHLAIVNSLTEYVVLKELFSKYPGEDIKSEFHTNSAFIGFQDWGEHGSWKTIHGETVRQDRYGLWADGQPNDDRTRFGNRGQYCGAFYRDGGFDDMWCFIRLPYICEKKPLRLPEPPTTPIEETSSTTDIYDFYTSKDLPRENTPIDEVSTSNTENRGHFDDSSTDASTTKESINTAQHNQDVFVELPYNLADLTDDNYILDCDSCQAIDFSSMEQPSSFSSGRARTVGRWIPVTTLKNLIANCELICELS